MGQPTKLTAKLQEELCKQLETCAFRGDAAALVGIGLSTLRLWLSKGANDIAKGKTRTKYAQLNEAVRLAEAKAKLNLLCTIQGIGLEAKRFEAFVKILEWRWPDQFSEHKKITVQIDKEREKLLDVAKKTLPDEWYWKLLAALDEELGAAQAGGEAEV